MASMMMMNTNLRVLTLAFQPQSSQSSFPRNVSGVSFTSAPKFAKKMQRTQASKSSEEPDAVEKAYKEGKEKVEENNKALEEKAKDIAGKLTETVEDVAEKAKDATTNAWDKAKDASS